MGWFHEDAPGHEGYPVALTERLIGDAYRTHLSIRLRELVSPYDRPEHELHHACAGCDCGWRSESIAVAEPMSWDDGYLDCSERVRARLERLWVEHRALVAYRIEVGDGKDRAACGDRLVTALSSVERCTCGHERRLHGMYGLIEERAAGSACSGWDHPFRNDKPIANAEPCCPCRKFVFQPTPA